MISLKVPAQSDPQKEAVSCLGFDTINKVFPQRDPGPARSKSAALAGNDDGIQEKEVGWKWNSNKNGTARRFSSDEQ